MNLQRLTELVVFILNHETSATYTEFLDLALRRPGQSLEKINQTMILAPLVGMILNLVDASKNPGHDEQNDIVGIFASMECSVTVHFGFQYLLDYNWGCVERGCISRQLERLSICLRNRTEGRERADSRVSRLEDEEESCCCICYSCEADTQFVPCCHKSWFGCITWHLLNSKRCFTTVIEAARVERIDGLDDLSWKTTDFCC